MNKLISLIILKVQGSYSYHLIFFVAYEWTKHVCLIYYTRSERFDRDKHSNLLSPFVTYKDDELLLIQFHGLYSQYLIFFVTYKCAQEARAFVSGKLFQWSVMKHTSLLGPFISYKNDELLWRRLWFFYLQHVPTFLQTHWKENNGQNLQIISKRQLKL